MAGAGWRDFIAGEVLTAANVQDYLQDQAVMTFASSAARGSAIASPTEGMVSFLKDSNLIEAHDGSAWKQIGKTTGGILQVVSTTKTDTFSTNAGSFTDITGLSATITPSSTSSKIFVLAHYSGSSNGVSTRKIPVRLLRDSTPISVGDAASTRTLSTTSTNAHDAAVTASGSFVYLDSPSSVSAITYKLQTFGIASTTVVINRSSTDTDSNQFERTTSSITLLEIAG